MIYLENYRRNNSSLYNRHLIREVFFEAIAAEQIELVDVLNGLYHGSIVGMGKNCHGNSQTTKLFDLTGSI